MPLKTREASLLFDYGEEMDAASADTSYTTGDSLPIDEFEEELYQEFLIANDRKYALLMLPFATQWYITLLAFTVMDVWNLMYGLVFSKDNEHVRMTWYLNGAVRLMTLLDLILVVIYKQMNHLKMAHTYITPSYFHLALDLISIAPFKEVYTIAKGEDANLRITYALALVSVLRLNRIVWHFSISRLGVGHNNLFERVAEFLTFMFISTMLVSVIIYYLACEYEICQPSWASAMHSSVDITPVTSIQWLIVSYHMACSLITMRGYSFGIMDNILFNSFACLLVFITYIYLTGFFLSHFATAKMQDVRTKYTYFSKLNNLKKNMTLMKISPEIYSWVVSYFEMVWKLREGNVDRREIEMIVPLSMVKEMCLDIFWDAFRHSHLFQNCEISFLRALSLQMEEQFLLPGQYVYESGVLKQSMVYVVSGVFQILSDEDRSTPIISLSGGTCIGESSLLLPYRAIRSVKCKTYCTVHILTRERFVRVIAEYPYSYRALQAQIGNRYTTARNHEELTRNIDPFDEHKYSRGVLTLRWLKYSVQNFLRDRSQRHKMVVDDLYEELDSYERLYFMADNLDMVVTAEQFELVTDTVFLRSSCPCILQPDSVLLRLWERLLLILAIITTIITPYYASFASTIPPWFAAYIYTVTALWFVDLYLKISTAYHTRDEIVVEISEIMYKRFGEVTFCIDILAVFPFELIVYIFNTDPTKKNILTAQMNRILKIWLLERYLQRLEHSMVMTGLQARAIKYIIYTLLSIYLTAVYFYFQDYDGKGCCKVGWVADIGVSDGMHSAIYHTFFTTQAVTGTALNDVQIQEIYTLVHYVVLLVLTSLFSIYLVGGLASILTLELSSYGETYLLSIDMKRISTELHFGRHVVARLWSFINCQWEYNEGSYLNTKSKLMRNAPTSIVRSIKINAWADVLRKQPIFQYMSDEFIEAMCCAMNCTLLPEKEVVVYAGSLCSEFYINLHGYCEVISSSIRLKNVPLAPHNSFGVFEFFFNIPNVCTVVTITSCEVLSLTLVNFYKVISEFPQVQAEIKEVVASMTMQVKDYDRRESLPFDVYEETEDNEINSTYVFLFDVGSKEEMEYNKRFARLNYFSFLQHLLMKKTFYPEGRFLIGWEISRCIFAVLSTILFCIPLISCAKNQNSTWYFVLIFLDCTAYVDLYVQMHVCFYNKDGILVTHPMDTAYNYITHRFLLDLISCFRFETFVFDEDHSPELTLQLSMVNRSLQSLRLLHFSVYFKEKVIEESLIVHMIRYGILQLLILLIITSLVITDVCWFDTDTPGTLAYKKGVRCLDKCWYGSTEFEKPYSPWMVYFYGLYYVTSIFTGTGMQGFTTVTDRQAIQVTLISILGYFYNAYLMAGLISITTVRNRDLPIFQSKMQALLSFIETKSIQPTLRRKITKYFEFVWQRRHAQEAWKLFENFHDMLREDILFNAYSAVLVRSSVFEHADEAFIRRLLLMVRIEFVMNMGIVLKINDINNKLFILYSGTVAVYGPAGVLFAVMMPGSIFGNIDDTPAIRQAITVVARGHVEMLTIDAQTFHKLLSNYKRFQYMFEKRTALNYDFLRNKFMVNTDLSISIPNDNDDGSVEQRVYTKFKTVLLADGWFLWVWNGVILYVICLVSYLLVLYVVAVNAYDHWFTAVLYVADGFFVFNIVLKFFTAYEDAYGVLVTAKSQIALTYVKTWNFKLDVFSILPLELIGYFLRSDVQRISIIGICRLNRCVRIVYVVIFMKKINVTLNSQMLRQQLSYTILWIVLILHAVSCILLIIVCVEPNSISANTSCIYEEKSNFQQLTVYMYHFYAVTSMFCSSSTLNYYPLSLFLIIYVILLMVGGHLVEIKLVSEICAALDMDHSYRNTYDRKISLLRGYMHHSSLSPALYERAFSYVKRLWVRQKGVQYPQLLDEAPYYIKEQVMNAMFGHYVENCVLFANCHVDFIRQLVTRLQMCTYFPGDYVCFEGDVHRTMYFIHQGEVERLVESTLFIEEKRKTFRQGDVFGIRPTLLPNSRYVFTYRAVSSCVLLSLHYKLWKDLLCYFPASSVEIMKQVEIVLENMII